METQQLDDLADDEAVVAHRARAKAELGQIAQQAKQAIAKAGIDISLFFLISNSNSILTFGTPGDPDDDLWTRIGEIVSAIVRDTVGLDRTRCREVVCATTDDLGQDADRGESR